MRHSCTRWALMLVVLAVCSACQSANAAKERTAGVAGTFYPADPSKLAAVLDGALAKASPSADGKLVALISPHAGYEYSGAVAAQSYALLKGSKFKRVIVIGPSHYESIDYSSVYDGDAYTTPLGRVVVDREFARKLAGTDRSIRLSSAGHQVRPQAEHSVEVQLPFLQRTLGEFSVVTIVMGDQSYDASRALGVALAKLLRNNEDTLLVASSDLSHYHSYAEASKMDAKLLAAVTQGDFLSVSRNTESRIWEACGAGPIVAVMIAAERVGASPAKLLKYANSGDVTGDKSRVVGYAALAFYRRAQSGGSAEIKLNGAQQTELLNIARASVESAVREGKRFEPAVPSSVALNQERGVFVTLKKRGELRGCIGYVSPIRPLYLAVRDVAAHAALRDSRFAPVRPEELRDLQYEISVLSPFQHVTRTESVHVGEHGLLVRQGEHEGVLLPQVPVEQHWNRRTFLDQAAVKAGLPSDAWQDAATDIFTFTALVFSEHDATNTRKNE